MNDSIQVQDDRLLKLELTKVRADGAYTATIPTGRISVPLSRKKFSWCLVTRSGQSGYYSIARNDNPGGPRSRKRD